MQSTSKNGSAIGVINVESISILDVLGISLKKKNHRSVKIAKNRGLEKVSLIQHKMISWCVISKWDTFYLTGQRKEVYEWNTLQNTMNIAILARKMADKGW